MTGIDDIGPGLEQSLIFWDDSTNKALFKILQGKVALMLAKDSYTLTVNKAEREILKEIFKENLQ